MFNRNFILIVIFAFTLLSCKKEEPDFSKGFIKYYGGIQVEDASEVQQTSDGGYIIIGTTSSIGNGGTDMYVVKTDAQGNKQWEKAFGGSLNDKGASLQQTSDGGFVFLGTYRNHLPGPDSNKTDIYAVKTDSYGNVTWTKRYGLISNEQGVSIRQTNDGGYILLGNDESDGDLKIIKTNTLGIATDSSKHPNTADDIGIDLGVNILQQADNSYVISSQAVASESPRIIFLTSTVFNSNAINAPMKDPGGFAEASMKTAGEAAFADNSYLVHTGTTNSEDVYLIKMNNIGYKIWYKTFGGAGSDIGTSVQQAHDGGYIIVGSTTSSGAGSSDIYLLKIDASGQNMEWSKTFGGAGKDVGKLVRKTSDGGYIILGTIEFGDDPSDSDNIMCLIKVDAKGEVKN